MKKLLLTLALAVSFTSLVNAQYFVTSFGVELGWNLPTRVNTVVYHDYYGYNVVHASRVSRYGVGYFDLILQRGDVFIEVSVRNDGWVDRRVVRYDYPLVNHVCGNVCGYHSNYYTTYYNRCSSHSHHGHNHVVYNNYKSNHHHGNGNAYGHNKSKGNKYDDNRDSRRSASVTYTRRDRNYNPDQSDSRTRVSRTTYSKSSDSRSGNSRSNDSRSGDIRSSSSSGNSRSRVN